MKVYGTIYIPGKITRNTLSNAQKKFILLSLSKPVTGEIVLWGLYRYLTVSLKYLVFV